jgi:diguanylate cyclase (GGDEF)-like protein
MRDPLTGAYSRYSFEDRLPEEVERARRYGETLCLLFVDLDHFKSVNDAFGHRRGDQVLVSFVERVRSVLRRSDVIFRYGGEEFVLLLPHTGKQLAAELAARILDTVSSRPFPGTPDLSVTISVGLASFPDDASDPESLLEKADLRLHEAKRQGRDRIVEQDPRPDVTLSFDESSRLIEREQALEALKSFLDQLPRRRRGVLVLTGERGAGLSRFLREVGRAGGMRGYRVIELHARQALKGRSYGALAQALRENDLDVALTSSEEDFSGELGRLLARAGASGVLFAVDTLAELDWETVELFRWLLTSSPLPVVGLAYTADAESARRSFPLEAPLREAVELVGFSHAGLRTWLRHVLGWEAPPDFVAWLHGSTRGLPAQLAKGLRYLVRRGILTRRGGDWTLSDEYRAVLLREKLGGEEGAARHNLPVALTSFVGRVRETEEVKQQLGRARLLTIAGPGGIGKTRLALQAAAEQMRRYPDGIFFVPLASSVLSPRVIPGIADAVGLSFTGRRDAKAELLDFLREKELLLVIDSFERPVQEDTHLVREILSEAPNVTVLATSRERLNIKGEVVLPLQGLRYERGIPEDKVEGRSAVQLFVQNARRAAPRFSLDEQTKQAVDRICELVEGNPLAIEIAGSWTAALSCEEIAEEISQSLDFLSTRAKDVPQRHRSLRAVFESSWQHLSNDEKEALRRLSVFPGGFLRDAAAHVAGAGPVLLLSLADKSIVRRDASGRHSIPKMIRQYAEQELRADPTELEETADRLAEYYAAFLGERQHHLYGGEQKEFLREIGEEIENVRVAWNRAVDRGRPEEVEKYISSLDAFFHVRCRFQEGADTFRAAEERLRDHPDSSKVIRGSLGVLLGRLLGGQGSFHHALNQPGEARSLLQNSLNVLDRCSAEQEMTHSYTVLGHVSRREGKHLEARQCYERALSIAERTGDQSAISRNLSNLSDVAFTSGDYGETRRLLERSLAISEKIRDRWGHASALNSLGNLADLLGDCLEAQRRYEESLSIYREIEDRDGTAVVLGNLGNIARRRGRFEESKRRYRESLQIYKDIGNTDGQAYDLNSLGDICLLLGEHEEAWQSQQESLALYERAGNPSGRAYSLKGLGQTELALGRIERARELFEQSVELFEEIDESWGLSSALAAAGEAHAAAAQAEEARHIFRRALVVASRIQAPPLILANVAVWAELLLQTGRTIDAARLAAHVSSHELVEAETKHRANVLLSRLERQLPPEDLALAKEEGRRRGLDEICGELLGSPTGQPEPPPDH